MNDSLAILQRLMETIENRERQRPEGSYTSKLFAGGVTKIGEKIIEEAAEVVQAAAEPGDAGKEHLTYEAGDLVYHLLVMLASRGVSLDDVARELGRREGIGGLVEKQQRSQSNNSNQ